MKLIDNLIPLSLAPPWPVKEIEYLILHTEKLSSHLGRAVSWTPESRSGQSHEEHEGHYGHEGPCVHTTKETLEQTEPGCFSAFHSAGTAGVKPCVCCTEQPETEKRQELLCAKIWNRRQVVTSLHLTHQLCSFSRALLCSQLFFWILLLNGQLSMANTFLTYRVLRHVTSLTHSTALSNLHSEWGCLWKS